MKKRFRDLTNEIGRLEQEIMDTTTRKTEAEERVNQAAEGIKALKNDLQDSLVADDMKKAASLEKEIDKLSKKVIDRDRILARGLEGKITDFNHQLVEAKKNKAKTFAKLCKAWLGSEASLYDGEAKKLIQRIKRLLVAHSALREIGATEIYTQAMGPGYEFLSSSRILVLKDFSKQEFLSGPFRSGIELRDKVFDEITK